MTIFVSTAAALVRAGAQIKAHKRKFAFLTFVVFMFSLYTLASADLLPDGPKSAPVAEAAVSAVVVSTSTPVEAAVPELPVKITIAKINLSATIANPETTDADVLDSLLLKGAVRYPTSAQLGVTGNVVLFGHSSYLPIVNNPAYKTFDGIQKLVAGDTITVYSADKAYTYKVRTMNKENINDAAIPLSVSGQVLTISTCNSFASKSDRFVVTADFVESHALGA